MKIHERHLVITFTKKESEKGHKEVSINLRPVKSYQVSFPKTIVRS